MYSVISAVRELSKDALRELRETGFIIIPGPVPALGHAESADHAEPADPRQLSAAYDVAVAAADEGDVRIGSTTTRVSDFVNRGAEFDALYVHSPILEACCHVIEQPFKLSNMLARTVRPYQPAQKLHVDFARDTEGWPMIGFILMVDDFRIDNGATRFVPGSHTWSTVPGDVMANETTDYTGQVVACGTAGSVIVYNGSVWHGHTANTSSQPRRSIQGAFIRRTAQSGSNLPERMRADTLDRIGPLARYLLALH